MVLMMAMETSAWMWKKRNFSASNKHFSACQHDSWQEQSLAEDSSELLCECTWPPRYYSCSFCRKEFKSAQALGGHMNVHRRDRARLRQSPNSQSEVEQHSCGFLDAHQHPPGVCSMVILNPNSRPEHSSPPSAVSSYESSKHTFSQHSSYQEPPLCDPLSKISSEFTAAGDLKSRNNLTCDVAWQELAIGSPDWLFGRRKMHEELLGSCDDETTAKRKRPRNCSTGYSRENAPSDLLYFQSIVEDLDLELRLGVSSKVD